MTDGIKVKGSIDPLATNIHADQVDYDGETGLAQRMKVGFGAPGSYADVDPDHPLPVTDTAVETAITTLVTALTSGGIALNAGTLAALEQIQAVVSGTVALDSASLAALEAITVNNPTDVSGLATQTTLAAAVTALQGTLQVAPSSAGDVAGTLTNGRKTVAAAGTAEAIRTTSLACRWVQVTALLTNTQQVNVGASGVSAASGSSSGTPLNAGDSVTMPVNDATKVFIDARVTGEGVSFLVGS